MTITVNENELNVVKASHNEAYVLIGMITKHKDYNKLAKQDWEGIILKASLLQTKLGKSDESLFNKLR